MALHDESLPAIAIRRTASLLLAWMPGIHVFALAGR
jgi:hypothetical protein